MESLDWGLSPGTMDVPWCCPCFFTIVCWSKPPWPRPERHFSSSHTPVSCIQLANHGAASREVILLSFQAILSVKGPLLSTYSSWSFPRSFKNSHNAHSLCKGPHSSFEVDRRSHQTVLPLDTLCSCFINCEPSPAVVPWLEDTMGCVYRAITMEFLIVDPFSEIHAPSHRAHPCQSKYTLVPNQAPSTESCLASVGRTLSMSVQKTRFWLPVTTQVGPHSAAI